MIRRRAFQRRVTALAILILTASTVFADPQIAINLPNEGQYFQPGSQITVGGLYAQPDTEGVAEVRKTSVTGVIQNQESFEIDGDGFFQVDVPPPDDDDQWELGQAFIVAKAHKPYYTESASVTVNIGDPP